MVKLLHVRSSERKGKKLVAKFLLDNGRFKTVNFGAKNSTTFAEGASDSKRLAYIARHKVNEDWTNPLTAGALSRYVLWEKKSIRAGVADFKRRFKV